jgi:hypothetical protein
LSRFCLFEENNEIVVARLNETTILSCPASNSIVDWYKLSMSVPREFQLLQNDMIIEGLKPKDFGRYICQWQDLNQTKQAQVLLEQEGANEQN